MTNSLLLTSPTAVSSAAPKFVRDPIIRPGTKFLFDMTDPRCHPSGTITTGAALGKTFTDLAAGVTAAVNSGSTISVNADGSLEYDGSTSGHELRIGTAGQFDMAPGEYEYLTLLTGKIPASGFTTTSFRSFMDLSSSGTNNAQVYIDSGTNGQLPRVSVGTGSASVTAFGSAGQIVAGAVCQIGAHYVPGVSISLIFNGAVIKTTTASVPSNLPSAAGLFFKLANNLKRTVYRFSHHDLTTSNSQETAQGLSESERLTAAQMALADWQYTSGTLAGAPRDAIA